ncbi:MAG: cohesin domain-containing protein [Patescibacteria group bacterium]|nr:cohesin domain-containing protein [Patescibacteria group bacterium]
MNKKIIFLLFLSLSFLLMPFFAVSQSEASLYLTPQSKSYNLGQTFKTTLFVSANEQSTNAVEAIVEFPANLLEVISVSKASSILEFWPEEPNFSNKNGIISFAGGLPTPGFNGNVGQLITITFRAKNNGTANVHILSGAVLANDGFGTNILSRISGAIYTIRGIPAAPPIIPEKIEAPGAPVVFSPTHIESEMWYSNNEPKFEWILPKTITAISYILDKNSETNPDNTPEDLTSEIIFDKTADGTHYFHIKFKNKGGWGLTAHRKIQIDVTPPEEFEIKIKEGICAIEKDPTIIFQAHDAVSGIDYYQIFVDEQEPIELTGVGKEGFKLTSLKIGFHQIKILAFDVAGNYISSFRDMEILFISPVLSDYKLIIIALLIIIFLLFILLIIYWIKYCNQKRHKKKK